MPKNRARIRATKALAVSSDIRHPDASYLADHRKLRLPDGTIHDFATGTLRYLARRGSGITALLNEVAEEAKSKGWSIIRLSEFDNEPTPAMPDLPKAPALIIAFRDHKLVNAPGRLHTDLEAGHYEGLNVIVMREPRLSDYEQVPLANGRTIHVDAQKAPAPKFDTLALAKVRIAFALRYADMLAAGTDPASSLDVVARDMDSRGTAEASGIGAAARSAIIPIRSGSTLGQELGAYHEELFGTHLVEVIRSSDRGCRIVAGLRDAAATLEADLRIGLIA